MNEMSIIPIIVSIIPFFIDALLTAQYNETIDKKQGYYSRKDLVSMDTKEKIAMMKSNATVVLYRNRMNTNQLLFVEFAGVTHPTRNFLYQDTGLLYYSFEYVISGKMCIETGGRKYLVKAGDTYVLWPGIDVKYYSLGNEKLEKMWFSVKGGLVDKLFEAYHLTGKVLVAPCNTASEIEKIHMLLLNSSGASYTTQQLALNIHQIIIKISEKENNVDFSFHSGFSLAEQLKSFIDSEYHFSYTLKMFAHQFCSTEKYLIRVFKDKYGITPYNYLYKKRIEAAKSFLDSTELTVKDIATKLCFANSSCFSKAFKKHTGLSPNTYRKQSKKIITHR